MWHDSLSLAPLGESGELIPDTLSNDDCVSVTMIVCIVLTAIMVSGASRYLAFQFSNLFRVPNESSSLLRETEKQRKYLNYFIPQGALLLSLVCYSYIDSLPPYHSILPLAPAVGVFSVACIAFYFLTEIVRRIVHATYFKRAQCRIANMQRQLHYFILSLILLPLSIAHVYLSLSIRHTLYVLLFAYILVKLLAIYKVYVIFFRKNGAFLHFFLYLCTLEAIPVAYMIFIFKLTAITLLGNFSD